MKFTVTPLGSAGGRSMAQVVGAIVDYLIPDQSRALPSPAAATGSAIEGPAAYYADSGEGPGRWLGRQAAETGLAGEVQPSDFARVLAGRDPYTGERLISARGSAGRTAHLGAGRETLLGPDDERLFDARDAASALGITVKQATEMMRIGIIVRDGPPSPDQGQLPDSPPIPVPTGNQEGVPGRDRDDREDRPGSPSPDREGSDEPMARQPSGVPVQPPGSYLIPVQGDDETSMVSEQELTRCERARAAGPDPRVIAEAGGGDDAILLAEAARLTGVGARYLRRLAGEWPSQRDRIEHALAEGRDPHQAWLPAFRGTRGRWFVRREDLVAFVERRRPPAVRVGFDLTLTTEKSLSVLALLSGGETRAAVLGAIRTGNDVAMAWFEDNAATTRTGGHAVAGRGWTVASFQHLTSRALDPFAHHHNVVANSIVGPDGVRRALDARDLYRHAKGASAIATVEMRHQLQALGVRWRQQAGSRVGSTGTWEIDGIPEPVLRDFSTRRTEIDAALEELEAAIGRGARLDEVGGIVLRTRAPKDRTPVEDLVEQWWVRARVHGFTPERLDRSVRPGLRASDPAPDEAVFAVLSGPDGVCATSSVFDHGDLLSTLAHAGIPTVDGTSQPVALPTDELLSLADRYLDSDHVIALPDPNGTGPLRFTTAAALAAQRRIVDRYVRGVGRGFGQVKATDLGTVLQERYGNLSAEQHRLVRSLCLSGDQVQCAIGRAGAGKTTAMAAAVEVWKTAGFSVFGATVKGEAARTLESASGVRCETVAWILAHEDPTDGPLDARTVVIVDEASTVSDHDLDRLTWLAYETRATLRFIGDPAQHGAVAAGGMFRVLCEHPAGHTPELIENHRLQHPADRTAAEALRAGDIGTALEALAGAGHLHIAEDELDANIQTLTLWWNAHQVGKDHPMVDRRNVTRHQLNRLAHRLLQANGEVSADEIHATSGHSFAVGDRVAARAVARHLHPPDRPSDYIRNGTVGSVIGVHPARQPEGDRLTIAFDNLGKIEVPRAFFDEHWTKDGRLDVGLDLAYALTSYAVQGSTFEASTSRIGEDSNRAEAYVNATRGRCANHLVLTRTPDPLEGEHLPAAPTVPLETSIVERLRRVNSNMTALELAGRIGGPSRFASPPRAYGRDPAPGREA